MRLKRVTIHNYRSIKSDLVLELDGRITTLVGASESGKTNVLEAIHRFNPDQEYQQDDLCTFCDEQPRDDCPMISAVFELTPAEARASSRDTSADTVRELEITKCFSGRYLMDGLSCSTGSADTPSRIKTFLDDTSKRVDELWAMVAQYSREHGKLTSGSEMRVRVAFHELNRYLWQSSEFTPLRSAEGANAFAELSAKWRLVELSLRPMKDSSLRKAAAGIGVLIREANADLSHLLEPSRTETDILKMVPRMLYVHDSDIGFLEDSVATWDLKTQDGEHRAMTSLLALAGLSVKDLAIGPGSGQARRTNLLRTASGKLSKNIRIKWLQEPISLELIITEEGLHVNVEGKEGHYGPLSDRSDGFRWFLSFYLNFVRSSAESGNVILLLDEPGTRLHASGQNDLLRAFREMADETQIIYTTHSPFMIDKNFPQRIRAVLKGGQGTHVDNKAYRPTRGGPYEPIRSAIGLSLGNSLFLGVKNLIVEGISDHILLTAASRQLARDGLAPTLDLQEICITPAGGAQNVPYLAYLANHEEFKTVVLLDSDDEGQKAARRIEKEGVVGKDNVILVADAATVKKGEVVETLEDLLEPSLYRQWVEATYQEIKGVSFALPSDDIIHKGDAPQGEKETDPEADGSSQTAKHGSNRGGIVRKCGEFFKAHHEEWGDLDKVLVARKVAEWLDEGEGLGEQSTKRFQKLFELISKKLS